MDFDNGVPELPGYVVVRPVVTGQTGLHVEIGLSCYGCTLLSGTMTPPIDKTSQSTNKWQTPSPQSIYNYDPQTGSAISSIPLYQGSGLDLTCTDCFLSLQQSELYLSVDYDSNGFENIQIEADVDLLANLDLSFSYDGDGDIVYTDPLVTDYTVFSIPFPVAGISFAATIEASLTAVMTLQGSGTLLLNTGITSAACALLDH